MINMDPNTRRSSGRRGPRPPRIGAGTDDHMRDYFTGERARPNLHATGTFDNESAWSQARRVFDLNRLRVAYKNYMGIQRPGDWINDVQCVQVPVINGIPYPEMTGICPKPTVSQWTTDQILAREPQFTVQGGGRHNVYFTQTGVKATLPVHRIVTNYSHHNATLQGPWLMDFPVDLFEPPTQAQLTTLDNAGIMFEVRRTREGDAFFVFHPKPVPPPRPTWLPHWLRS